MKARSSTSSPMERPKKANQDSPTALKTEKGM
jgi:hypothetical protein